ncbi:MULTISPECIES: molybdopterin-dependent oxidoreductase [unclassified Campylobacter]|uniref:molybdopterin-dependent oxidoreductase n=1 Tax=unclassified Campylobacter TaxID=2593542 RepID=UPI001DFB3BC1|nr:molybdopterin-dependent oxidoreductase [Campylobacter sp. MG1]MBZ7983927.1 molybdopterin-dependent oxidoreductase [Campylobacter sp. RM12647]
MLNRRSFLKGSAAVGAMSFAPINVLGAESKAVASGLVKNGEVVTGAHWGILKLTIKDGKVVKSEPFDANQTKNLKNDLQHYTPDLVYANRVKYPYVRKSFLENPLDNKPELRGKDEWVRVSWDKALKLVAESLKRTYDEKGANGIFAGSYGWKSSGNVHNSRILLHRFMNLTGGFVGSLGDYSTGASQVIMPHVVGSIEVYEQQTNLDLVLENTKVIVIWGANPIDTLKIAWTVTDGEGRAYMEKIKESKIKVICIDPRASSTVKFFEGKGEWLAPRPNTDVAMMMGMATYLIDNKLYDAEFMENYTIGFDKFSDYLMGKTDGVKKDSKWAENICGIKASVIENLAKELRENLSLVMSGWGMQRAHHGEQPHWMLVTLCAMLGHIGKDGGGFGLSYHYSNGGVATTNAPIVGGINASMNGLWDKGVFKGVKQGTFDKNGKFIPGNSGAGENLPEWLSKTSDNEIPVARIADMLLNPGKTIDHNGKKITYSDIDFVYWVGGNPFVHHQDLKTLKKAWQKLKTVVVNEIYWTPTARMADILLPTTSQYERNDISMSGDYSNMHIVPMKAAVMPVEESKDDMQIFVELAKVYGTLCAISKGASEKDAAMLATKLVNAYTENQTPEQMIEKYYNAAKKSTSVEMPDFKEFWENNKALKFEASQDAYEFVRFKDFVEDPILNPLGTPSGLIEIYSETIEKMNYKDCKAHPMWFEPIEWLGMKEKSAEFHMISPHPTSRLHSQLCHTSLRETYAVNGHEPILINSEDAKAKGIKNGDLVEVFNARGKVIAGAVVSNDVLKGVVVLQEGGWYDPDDNNDCKYGCANVLTIDIPTSELANGNISHTALVNIKKFEGEKPEIVVFTEPVKA